MKRTRTRKEQHKPSEEEQSEGQRTTKRLLRANVKVRS